MPYIRDYPLLSTTWSDAICYFPLLSIVGRNCPSATLCHYPPLSICNSSYLLFPSLSDIIPVSLNCQPAITLGVCTIIRYYPCYQRATRSLRFRIRSGMWCQIPDSCPKWLVPGQEPSTRFQAARSRCLIAATRHLVHASKHSIPAPMSLVPST